MMERIDNEEFSSKKEVSSDLISPEMSSNFVNEELEMTSKEMSFDQLVASS